MRRIVSYIKNVFGRVRSRCSRTRLVLGVPCYAPATPPFTSLTRVVELGGVL